MHPFISCIQVLIKHFFSSSEKGKLVHRHRYYTRLQARLMATPQDHPEFELESHSGADDLVVEILNPEQLAQENQVLKEKVGAMEVQLNEVMAMLQNLKSGAAAETTAVVGPDGVVSFVPPPRPANAATAPPPPGPGVNHLVCSPGVNAQSQPIAQRYPWGMPVGYMPRNVESNPAGVTGPSQTAVVVSGGAASGPQVHAPNHDAVLQGNSSSPTPGLITPTQNVAYQVGNPAQFGGYYYGIGSHPQGHVFENSQPRDQYRVLEERLRAVEGTGVRAKDARDLCLVPDIVLPPKFKAPDFDKYRGTGCPSSHITMYCRKMAAYASDDKLLIHCFQNSLGGASLDWYMQLQSSDIHSWKDLSEAFLRQYQYNMDMAPDRSQLQHMGKGDKESFKEYAQRWRGTAAQVKPPLTEKEMVYMFMETLPAIYYDRLIGSVSSNFSDMVVIGERLENGLRSGKIANHFGSSGGSGSSGGQKKHSSHFPKKKEGETNVISGGNPSFSSSPQTVPFSAPVQPQQVTKKRVSFDPIPMTYTELFNHLVSKNLINTRSMKPLQPPFPRGYNANATCSFHEGGIGHTVEDCKAFKHVVQDLIDANWISFKQNSPSTTTNPLPGHGRPSTNAIDDSTGQMIRGVETVKTPLSAIHDELCRFGVIKKGCCQENGCADSLCNGACETFKLVLQDLMDRRVVQVCTFETEGSVMTLQSNNGREARRPIEILYDYNPRQVQAKAQPIVIEIPAPFPYEKDSAVPWKYSTLPSGESSPNSSAVTNISGVSGITRSGRMYAPETLRAETSKAAEDRGRKGKEKESEMAQGKKTTEQEADEFLMIVRQSDYQIVDQLKQTPAKISMLSLLLSSEAHRTALMKVLSDAHVAQDISVCQFDGIVGNIVAANHLTFADDELPPGGRKHNQALHISVKCGDYVLARVLIDNGSSLNVMPKSTMDKLDVDCSYMKPSSTLVRAFDGSKKEVLGEMEFPIQIGPETFYVNFQIMDITSSYSCLLGRPWIHMAGAIPSSLHQRVKFVVDDKIVVVFGEEEMLVNKPSPFRYVEAAEESLETSFQSLEIANAVFGGSELSSPGSKLSRNEEMVARIMLEQGYKVGCGLGKTGQGILAPIQLKENRDRCGLGYHPSQAERKKMAEERKDRWLAKSRGQDPWSKRIPICDIRQSFTSAGLLDPNQIAAIGDGSEDEVGETSLVRRCLAGEKLKNWETADFPVAFNSK